MSFDISQGIRIPPDQKAYWERVKQSLDSKLSNSNGLSRIERIPLEIRRIYVNNLIKTGEFLPVEVCTDFYKTKKPGNQFGDWLYKKIINQYGSEELKKIIKEMQEIGKVLQEA